MRFLVCAEYSLGENVHKRFGKVAWCTKVQVATNKKDNIRLRIIKDMSVVQFLP